MNGGIPPSKVLPPELLLVAVVEWNDDNKDGNYDRGQGHNTDGAVDGIQKVRITTRDVRHPPAVTATDLHAALRHEQQRRKRTRRPEDIESSHHTPTTCPEPEPMVVRVYDAALRDWVPLSSVESSTHKDDEDNDLASRFGRRIRVEVSVPRKESSANRPLALPGRCLAAEWVDDHRFVVGGATLYIHQRRNKPDTAGCVWDGATLLARCLERNAVARNWIRGQRVLELGAGCGLAGLVAGALGAAHVVLTDLARHVPPLRRNVDENAHVWKRAGCRDIFCCECDWTRPPRRLVTDDGTTRVDHNFDVILVADCVWMEHLVDPLLATIDRFVTESSHRGNGSVRVLFAYQRRGRGTHDRFWRGLQERFGSIEELRVDNLEHAGVLTLLCSRRRAAHDDF